ncbi:SulP family sulfate permease [Arcticibacter pallidicorallinus]|uniref:SulP family sulfate permease n=1 Tax=Arcticibacter pallidicorallinus TaxID=1259464 RepID=A0A2T0U986_9SPHI|nr:SulP family inorganic anion transporter [Arcticibacter pallidicorallinus]PRY54428.1 SulP family sulfate permease [Arcticibacter pallidicorallinus]
MPASKGLGKYFSAQNLKKDLPASLVVFLVALPLCLGIALASGAPLFAGLLTGIIGGIVVAAISGSQLSVSGPAAGLTVIVFTSIAQLGGYEIFLLALVIAGILQVALGFMKAGTIANFFPSSVIEGMLAAIGIILIMKQIPYALGYNADFEGSESFQSGGSNTISGISDALSMISPGAIIISVLSLLVLIYWSKIKKVNVVPAPLVVVIIGIALNFAFKGTSFEIAAIHLVQVPVVNSFSEFTGLFMTPDFSQISNPTVWTVAFTIAIVASLESLLSLEAVDKIDPYKRVSPTNRELVAQGTGNLICGLVGGLPLTAVIVRSSANVNSGGKTKASSMLHGLWLLASLLLIPGLINSIPLSCLAAVLIFTGSKLAKLALFKKMWREGKGQFIPFIVTILAVVFTDLLKGVAIGMVIGVFFILRNNMRNPYFYTISSKGNKDVIRITLSEEVSFLNKAAISYTLNNLPPESDVIIDGTNSKYIDPDVLEVIHNFKHNAYSRAIIVKLENIKHRYDVPQLKEMIYKPEKVHENV